MEIWSFGVRDLNPHLDGLNLPDYPDPDARDSSLRAIWQPWTDGTIAFGPDGLVYDYLWDRE